MTKRVAKKRTDIVPHAAYGYAVFALGRFIQDCLDSGADPAAMKPWKQAYLDITCDYDRRPRVSLEAHEARNAAHIQALPEGITVEYPTWLAGYEIYRREVRIKQLRRRSARKPEERT